MVNNGMIKLLTPEEFLEIAEREVIRHKYICGSTNPDKFKEMKRIVYHYAKCTPGIVEKKLKNGKVYYGIIAMLTLDEQDKIRQEISWIGIPESLRRV